ncbi:MAG: excinuclease ABC subunit UvrC [Bacteroidaceae bacterium]|nr:excinuclease ABC subunit UvrC [Bacteroidaceae bacterium]
MKKTNPNIEDLKGTINNLPEKPGCYQYLDDNGRIIYVGKAKNLKRRVSSYFNKEHSDIKTTLLVTKICQIKYIVVETDQDALLLENSLIKKHKPRYNILLKDDKTYPSVCITKEPFPRVFKTRIRKNDGSAYYGPYSHVATLNMMLELIGNLYNIRSCSLRLTQENVDNGKYKECLDWHIKKCNAPCIGKQSREEYNLQIEQIREILNGNIKQVEKNILERIEEHSTKLEFEKAQVYKEKLDSIIAFKEKSQVVSVGIENTDVFSIESDGDIYFINYLHVSNGFINQAYTTEFKKKMDESDTELLTIGIVELRNRYKSKANEIIVPFKLDYQIEGVKITIPERGDKLKLLKLSILNVKQYKIDREKRMDKLNPEQKQTRVLKELQNSLGLKKIPVRIECFDNSHINGESAVAACIVWEKGKPKKDEYRLFKLDPNNGGDDYASMAEVITRRYTRLKEESGCMPDLILVDGGKGQMSIACKIIEELKLEIPIAGLVKNSQHSTRGLLFGNERSQVGIKPGSELFKMLERMQDEVHRFAINFHRKSRSKKQVESQLDKINGIGNKTAEKLLKKFKSTKRIKEASLEEIAEEIGMAKAKIIKENLN